MKKWELCEDHQWVMRKKDGGKRRGKQPQWDEGRCHCFTLLHKTITSQAPRSPSIYLGKKQRSGGGREREGELLEKRKWRLLLKKKKCPPTQVRAQWDRKPKKTIRTGKFSLCQRLQRLWCNNNQNSRRTGTRNNPTRCPFMSEKALRS